MSHTRQKDDRIITESKEEDAEGLDHASLLEKVNRLAQEIDEYLEKYPPEEEESASFQEEDRDEPSSRATKNIGQSELSNECLQGQQPTQQLPLSGNRDHNSSDPRTLYDTERAHKRIRPTSHEEPGYIMQETSKEQEQDFLNADFIAL